MATYIYQYTAASATGGSYGIGVLGSDGTSFRYLATDAQGGVYVTPSGAFNVSANNLTAFISGSATVSGNVSANQAGAWDITGVGYVSGGSAIYVTASGAVSAVQSGGWDITGVGYVSGGSAIYVTASGQVSASAAQSGAWNITGVGYVSGGSAIYVTASGAASARIWDGTDYLTYSKTAGATAAYVALTGSGGAVGVTGGVITAYASAADRTDIIISGNQSIVPQFVRLSAFGSGNTSAVAASGSLKIRALRLSLVALGTVTVKFQSSTTDITGPYSLAANGGWVEPYCPLGIFETAAGEALNINLGAATTVGGSLTYIYI